jgi:hypothetical protein
MSNVANVAYDLSGAAREAIVMQDACNLSGVVHAFSRAMSVVRENASGTDEANVHPIAVLFADKIMDLVRRPSTTEYCRAYEACKRLAGEGF